MTRLLALWDFFTAFGFPKSLPTEDRRKCICCGFEAMTTLCPECGGNMSGEYLGAFPDGNRAAAASQSNPQAVSSIAGIPSRIELGAQYGNH